MGGRKVKAPEGEADQLAKEKKGQGFSGSVKTKKGDPLTNQPDSPAPRTGRRKGGYSPTLKERLLGRKL